MFCGLVHALRAGQRLEHLDPRAMMAMNVFMHLLSTNWVKTFDRSHCILAAEVLTIRLLISRDDPCEPGAGA